MFPLALAPLSLSTLAPWFSCIVFSGIVSRPSLSFVSVHPLFLSGVCPGDGYRHGGYRVHRDNISIGITNMRHGLFLYTQRFLLWSMKARASSFVVCLGSLALYVLRYPTEAIGVARMLHQTAHEHLVYIFIPKISILACISLFPFW